MSGDVDFFLLREQERNKSLLVSIWGGACPPQPEHSRKTFTLNKDMIHIHKTVVDAFVNG